MMVNRMSFNGNDVFQATWLAGDRLQPLRRYHHLTHVTSARTGLTTGGPLAAGNADRQHQDATTAIPLDSSGRLEPAPNWLICTCRRSNTRTRRHKYSA